LAPAGDIEKLKFAILFGADAVYLGLKELTMRTSTCNFTPDELKMAVNFAHQRNVKVYLTCNTTLKNNQVKKLPEFMELAKEAKVDAVIVADMGAFAVAKQSANCMDIHISTQAGVTNFAAANEFFKLGAKRIILARELSLKDIREIRRNTPHDLELEVFVHGAMCMAFSGRCLLSSFLTGRSANEGECAQPCRWNYHLFKKNQQGEYFPVYENDDGSYILNAKDLCMIEHLPELEDAGISSFKIEGRSKSFYYVAVVTNAYKQALELFGKSPKTFKLPDFLREEVNKVSHREYSTGFYFGMPCQFIENGGYLRNYDVVATVESCDGFMVNCSQRNKFEVPTTVELISPGKRPLTLTIEKLFDEFGQQISSVPHAMMKFKFESDFKLPEGTIIRKLIE
jgi:putative protease